MSGGHAIRVRSAPAFNNGGRQLAITQFRYQRRVQFQETDASGNVHFTWFFRYLEEAEHAMWRAAGLSIAPRNAEIGWPRVAASFEYKKPLRFEDEFEVHLMIAAKTRRTIRYRAVLSRNGDLIATGGTTIICVRRRPGEAAKVADIPPEVDVRFDVAPEADVQAEGLEGKGVGTGGDR
jgi:YbgC/YbaW family acyl-CoA thioester hydrolase